ncbi:hypothetical protein B0T11DRAFT_277736 [Plectosphaerella cucumerina]|uniref:Uncharacterized protein n=1 Tax=Plectosphaerella cucumerina TaxID=40658 RepID=A0A8K0TSM2_9PEZI|nr:hypothetical protein B0T11DRAFT_277736 [Plectosphaerella cucumerina]
MSQTMKPGLTLTPVIFAFFSVFSLSCKPWQRLAEGRASLPDSSHRAQTEPIISMSTPEMAIPRVTSPRLVFSICQIRNL